MVNILILSNNLSQARQLSSNLLRFAPDLKIRMAQSLADAESMGQKLRLRLAFVDRSLAEGRVVDLAERLRLTAVNRFLPIVMLGTDGDTGRGDEAGPTSLDLVLASLGMVFFPFPMDPDELKRLLDQVFVEWRARDHCPNSRVFIDQAGAARWVSEDDIVFVEYVSRRVVIHLRKEVIEYKYMPLQKFAAQLSSQFIQVHQSYVVNFSAIKSYNRQQAVLKMVGSPLPVPVGRSYQKNMAELIREKFD